MAIQLNKPASQIYSEKRLRALLQQADENATKDWDRNFVNDMADRFKTYGMGMYISNLQRHHLERIAND